MPNIYIPYGVTAQSVRVKMFNGAGLYLKTSNGALVTYNSANLSQYYITATEIIGSNGLYVAIVPTIAVLPVSLNYIAEDAVSGDMIAFGQIDVDAAGNEVSPFGAGVSIAEGIRRIAALNMGVITDANTGQEDYKDWAGNACVSIIVDESGNRTSTTFH